MDIVMKTKNQNDRITKYGNNHFAGFKNIYKL